MTKLNLEGMELASGVIETIVSIVVQEVEGVAAVGPTVAGGFRSVFVAKPSTQGIDVVVDEEDKLQISVRIDVYYGYVLPEVAANVRKVIVEALSSQVGASVDAVDVYIDGLRFVQ